MNLWPASLHRTQGKTKFPQPAFKLTEMLDGVIQLRQINQNVAVT